MKQFKRVLITIIISAIFASCDSKDMFETVEKTKEPEIKTAPATPLGLTAGMETSSTIRISWTASVGATEYLVYRDSYETGLFDYLVYQGVDTFFTDTELTPSTTCYYKVAASNVNGTSLLSAFVYGTTLDPPVTIPDTPLNVSASPESSSSIKITWNPSTGAESYQVYRDSYETGYFDYLVYEGTDTTFIDINLSSETTFYYKVAASNTIGASALSGVVWATTTGTAPGAITGLSAVATSPITIDLNWDSTQYASSFRVYRDTNEYGSYSELVFDGPYTYFSNTGLSAGTTYYYKVCAVNTYGIGPLSPIVYATTQNVPVISYVDLTMANIQGLAGTMSTAPIYGSNSNNQIPVGQAVIYQTKTGKYGKFRVVAFQPGVNNDLTIEWVTYNTDGTVYSSGSSLLIRGTWCADLDAGIETVSNYDFHWNQITSTERYISPSNGAVFALYTIPDSFTGLTRSQIQGLSGTLSTNLIYGSNTNNQIPVGQIVIYQTKTGKYGKFRVKIFQCGVSNDLTIEWVTYNSDGTVYSSGSNLLIRGTWACDLDAGLETLSNYDFFWNQVTSTERYISPANGAVFALYNP